MQQRRDRKTGSLRGLAAMPAMLASCLVLLSACGVTGGMTPPRPETRTPIEISAKEGEQLRRGMRIYLESVEGIVDAAQQNSMAQVARSAKRSGMDMLDDISISDALKLPPEFKY